MEAMKLWVEPTLPIHYVRPETEPQHDLPDYHSSTELALEGIRHSLPPDQLTQLITLLRSFQAVIDPELSCTHLVSHKIVTGEALPIAQPYYRCPEAWKKKFVDELSYLKEKGFVEESLSPWAAPMFPIPKKDGSIRLVVDYRRLNQVTEADPYSMPRIEVLLELMGHACLFTTLDLRKGYYQVPVDPAHRTKTAFVTQFGKFQFTVMPFGLKNAPATFQRLMDTILHNATEFAVWYIDDICIFSCTWDDHLSHLDVILTKLREANLTLQLVKCVFAAPSCDFLGHHVAEGIISPQKAKTEAVDNFRKPKTKKDVRSFLGLTRYYRRYIPNFSTISAPLSDLTKNNHPDIIEWTNDCQKAFDTLKRLLTSQPTLAPPDNNKPFIVHTDASDRGIGAVLSQGEGQLEHPIAFYSGKLLPREQMYSATEKEGLAVADACRHYLPYLVGRHFTICMDNRALHFLTNKDPTSGRLARWMDTLRALSFTIRYRPGSGNGNADGLSHQAWETDDSTFQKEGEVSGTT